MNHIDIDLASQGGRGDGDTDNSAAFARAFAAIRDAGGGTLTVGAGTWKTGPLELFSHTTLHLDDGAVVSFLTDPARYPPVRTRWEGVECFAMHPLIFAAGQTQVSVTGRGVFEGNGERWWQMHRAKKAAKQMGPVTPEEKALGALNGNVDGQPSGGGGRGTMFLRPPFLQLFQCTDVTLEGFTLRNSPFWTVHPVYVDGLVIRGLLLQNPADAPNTDGIDVDSCEHVTIEDCRVCVGDDGIALKSGSGPDGLRVGRPTAHVVVRNCVVNDAHGGIVIGSETAGGIADVLAEDCTFSGTDRGIRVKTRRGRGGTISGLTFRNLTMERNLCPLAINMFYRCGADNCPELFVQTPQPLTDVTPAIQDITVEHVRATGCRASAGFVAGLPERPITGLTITDCVFETDETAAASPDESDMYLGVPPVNVKSFRVLNAAAPVFTNVTVRGPGQAFLYG
jgi:polygalacturonase